MRSLEIAGEEWQVHQYFMLRILEAIDFMQVASCVNER